VARSIEFAAKALHLAQGRSAKDLRRVDHDLIQACDDSILSPLGITLTPNEQAQLKKANEYYSGKGFEYFFFKSRGVAEDRSGPQAALSGWPDRPDEKPLEAVLEKLLAVKL
jgi:hypothetical protein